MSVFSKHSLNVWQISHPCHKYQKYQNQNHTLFETGILYGCVTSPVLDNQHSMYKGMMYCMAVLPTPMYRRTLVWF
jgi:hypothetical protein